MKDIATGNVIPQEPIELLTISSHTEKEQEQIGAEAVVEQRRITKTLLNLTTIIQTFLISYICSCMLKMSLCILPALSSGKLYQK